MRGMGGVACERGIVLFERCGGHRALRAFPARRLFRSGNELTNLELVDRLLGLCGADPSLVEMVEDRPGHDRRYSVDAARVRALGWMPGRDLEEGLAATVDWYRDNRWWWGPLRDNPLGR